MPDRSSRQGVTFVRMRRRRLRASGRARARARAHACAERLKLQLVLLGRHCELPFRGRSLLTGGDILVFGSD